jgi:carbon-monoxide dehydrogenase large subunit
VTQVAERAQRYMGGGVLRKEDPELISGQARFIDDITLPGMQWVGIVRSPFAHARINSIDTSRAKEMPGVVAVFSGPTAFPARGRLRRTSSFRSTGPW